MYLKINIIDQNLDIIFKIWNGIEFILNFTHFSTNHAEKSDSMDLETINL